MIQDEHPLKNGRGQIGGQNLRTGPAFGPLNVDIDN